MRIEKAYHSLINIGPGGRHCPCCAPRDLKRRERRKARQKANLAAKKEAERLLTKPDFQNL